MRKFLSVLANGATSLMALAFGDLTDGKVTDNAKLKAALLENHHGLFATTYEVVVKNVTAYPVATFTIPANYLRFGDLINVKGMMSCTASTNTKSMSITLTQGGLTTVLDQSTAAAATAMIKMNRDVQVAAGGLRSWSNNANVDFNYFGTWGAAFINAYSAAVDTTINFNITAPATESVTFVYGVVSVERQSAVYGGQV